MIGTRSAVEPVLQAEIEWGKIASEPSPEDRLEYERWLVASNMPFAVSMAKRFFRPNIESSDLVAAAVMGMCEAAKTYRPDTGRAFVTHAKFRCFDKLYEAVAKGGLPIAVPTEAFKDWFYRKCGKGYVDYGDDSLDVIDLLVSGRMAEFLDGPARRGDDGGDGSTKMDFVKSDSSPCPEASASRRSESDAIMAGLRGLSARKRYVVERYFGLDGREPWNTIQLSEDLLVSKQAVSKSLQTALREIRENRRGVFDAIHEAGVWKK